MAIDGDDGGGHEHREHPDAAQARAARADKPGNSTDHRPRAERGHERCSTREVVDRIHEIVQAEGARPSDTVRLVPHLTKVNR